MFRRLPVRSYPPHMRALVEMGRIFPRDYLSSLNLSGVIHVLPSTAAILKVAKEINGLNPKHVAIAGKFNSEHFPTTRKILEDGLAKTYLHDFLHPFRRSGIEKYYAMEAKLHRRNWFPSIRIYHGNIANIEYQKQLEAKYKIKVNIAIESTRSGHKNVAASGQPVILPSGSAIKNHLEPAFIIDQIERVTKMKYAEFVKRQFRCGLVGYGRIGKMWAKKLAELNYPVCVYDNGIQQDEKTPENFPFASSPEELLQKSDFIFNCSTGDFTSEKTREGIFIADFIEKLPEKKYLISCSSDLTAYKRLVEKIRQKTQKQTNPLSDIQYYQVVIANGGYPINFTKKGDVSDPRDIQLTRLLLYGAILQAKSMIDSGITLSNLPKSIMFDPNLQKLAVRFWKKHNPNPYRFFTKEELDPFDDEEWIKNNSEGTYIENPFITNLITKKPA